MYAQELKFVIKIIETGERISLDLIFVIDGVHMTEDKMIERIKEKLAKAANEKKYKIVSWIRHRVDFPEENENDDEIFLN